MYLIFIDYVWYEALFFKPLYLIDTFIYEVLNIFSFLSCMEFAEAQKLIYRFKIPVGL